MLSIFKGKLEPSEKTAYCYAELINLLIGDAVKKLFDIVELLILLELLGLLTHELEVDHPVDEFFINLSLCSFPEELLSARLDDVFIRVLEEVEQSLKSTAVLDNLIVLDELKTFKPLAGENNLCLFSTLFGWFFPLNLSFEETSLVLESELNTDQVSFVFIFDLFFHLFELIFNPAFLIVLQFIAKVGHVEIVFVGTFDTLVSVESELLGFKLLPDVLELVDGLKAEALLFITQGTVLTKGVDANYKLLIGCVERSRLDLWPVTLLSDKLLTISEFLFLKLCLLSFPLGSLGILTLDLL
jgi:hypothetical protein